MTDSKPSDMKDTTQFDHHEKGDELSLAGGALEGAMDLRGEERKKAEKKLKVKLDIRLVATMIFIFVLNYIDRNALASARLKGLEADLNLSDSQYRAALAILYASYSPAQLPSNLILNYIKRPSLYMSCCIVLWGLFSTLTGVVDSAGPLLGLRFLVGLPEAAFYCGAMFMISKWFTKAELAVRGALFYVGLLMSNAFGPLVAAGILSNMEGDLGHRAWRWVFFIEGGVTMVVGVAVAFILPDWPSAKPSKLGFSREELLLAQKRMAEDASAADEDLTGASFLHGFHLAIRDPVVWIFVLATFLQIMGLSYTNFFPTLVGTLGYGSIETLLLTAPPWVWTSSICVINAWHADKVQERCWHLTWLWACTVVGYIMMMATQQVAVRYVSLFLLSMSYAAFALTLVYVSNAIPRPPAKRAATMGLVNGIGNLGNLCGSFIWKSSWGPSYRIPAGICMASLILAMGLYISIRQILVNKNKKLERMAAEDMTEDSEGYEELEKYAKLEGISIAEAMENRRNFRYIT